MIKAGIKLKKRLESAGKAGRGRNELSFRSLRHSFNTAMANAGISQEIRQKLTGKKGWTRMEFEGPLWTLLHLTRDEEQGCFALAEANNYDAIAVSYHPLISQPSFSNAISDSNASPRHSDRLGGYGLLFDLFG